VSLPIAGILFGYKDIIIPKYIYNPTRQGSFKFGYSREKTKSCELSIYKAKHVHLWLRQKLLAVLLSLLQH